MSENSDSRSTTDQSEVNWSQVQETVRMLFLAVAQIEIALTESDESFDHLTHSFTNIMGYEKNITQAVEDLSDSEETRAMRDSIRHNTQKVRQEIQGAIIAFQFYDKLTQRLSHVSSSIEAMSGLVGDSSKNNNPAQWNLLQEAIKSRYSMREEYEMFDNVMKGDDVREAVRKYNEAHKDDLSEDIEFF